MAMTEEEKAKTRHDYYLRNKALYIERAKKWAKENPERCRESVLKGQKKYYQKNRTYLLQKRNERHAAVRDGRPPREKLNPEEQRKRRNESAKKYWRSEKGKKKRREYYAANKENQSQYSKKRYKSQKKTPGQVLNELKNANNQGTNR